jgi:hypothetical protein
MREQFYVTKWKRKSIQVDQRAAGGINDTVNMKLRNRIDRELELCVLARINRQRFEEEQPEAGASAAERVENLEALHPGALVGELMDAVEDQVNDLLAHSVVVLASLFAAFSLLLICLEWS